MRTSLARLGLGFGQLGVTIRGTTKYHISPLEQRAFAGAMSQGKGFHQRFSPSLTPVHNCRSSQHFLESQEVLLHSCSTIPPDLLDLHRDREGA